MQRIAPVPLYDTLGPESVRYVVDQTSLAAVVCSAEVLENVLAVCDASSLKTVIQMEPVSVELKQRAKQMGVSIYGFEEVLCMGSSGYNTWCRSRSWARRILTQLPLHVAKILPFSATHQEPQETPRVQ